MRRAFSLAAGVARGVMGGASLRAHPSGMPALQLRWCDEIEPTRLMQAPQGIWHLDATADAEIVRCFLPGAQVTSLPPSAAPFVYVVQVEDTDVSYRSVVPGKNRSAKDRQAAEHRARKIGRVIEHVAKRHAGEGAKPGPDVLAVLPMATEEALCPGLPANVATLHFGALRGQDAYKGVRLLILVGRPLPSPRDMEDTAEVLFGRDVTRLQTAGGAAGAGPFYPREPVDRVMVDGTTRKADAHRHPDPWVERVRVSVCEAELIQGAGRARGAQRTAANPLLVMVLTAVPLAELPPDETTTLNELLRDHGGLRPAGVLLEAGIVPTDWRGRGMILQKVGLIAPTVPNPARAAEQAFRRVPGSLAELRSGAYDLATPGAEGANVLRASVSSSLRNGVAHSHHSHPPAPAQTGQTPAPWRGYLYRRQGERKAAAVQVAPWHAAPRAAVESYMGGLEAFAPAAASLSRRRTAKPAAPTTPAPTLPIAATLEREQARAMPNFPPAASDAALLRLPDVIRACGRRMTDFHSHMLSPAAKRALRDMEARGIRSELARAALAREWIGHGAFTTAMSQVARSA